MLILVLKFTLHPLNVDVHTWSLACNLGDGTVTRRSL